ncbi:unnamed protein product [Phytophthora fragariaefolia]|uniref:Unnamed protein product n=1 Tax=Phytophthora fragariaefolia TaxID=1490495 RepID=A0A9W6U896_9STRA|nr:unnamed protein product [Phytophthora fragariaefolia]
MKSFIKAAQRITFDGEHTLSVVFMSHRAVALWAGEEFKLRGQSVRLLSLGTQEPDVHSLALLARKYALRILGTEGIHAVPLVQPFEDITRVAVFDVRPPGMPDLVTPDNDYWTVIFDARSCPPELSGVSVIQFGDLELTLHQFQRHQLPSCWRCLNPNHTQARCKVPDARLTGAREPRLRTYTGGVCYWIAASQVPIKAAKPTLPASTRGSEQMTQEVKKYHDTLAAYHILAGGEDLDSDAEDERVPKEANLRPPNEGTAAHRPAGGLHTTTRIAGTSSVDQDMDDSERGPFIPCDAPPQPSSFGQSADGDAGDRRKFTTVQAAPTPMGDVDMEEAATGPQQVGTAEAGRRAMGASPALLSHHNAHSPSSETDPSQEPYCHPATPVAESRSDQGDQVT